ARRRPSANATSAIVFDSACDFSKLMASFSSRELGLQRLDHVLRARHERAARAHGVGEAYDLSGRRLDPERAGVAHTGELPVPRGGAPGGNHHPRVAEEESA